MQHKNKLEYLLAQRNQTHDTHKNIYTWSNILNKASLRSSFFDRNSYKATSWNMKEQYETY